MSSSPGETDRALIARVEARDADALSALYDMYAARLLGLGMVGFLLLAVSWLSQRRIRK